MEMPTSKLPLRSFVVADLTPRGEVRAATPYTYDLLAQLPGAAELMTLFAAELELNSEEFDAPLVAATGLRLRWRAVAPTAGVATLRDAEKTLSVSLLASGINPEADEATLSAFQRHILRELHDTGFEASFDLMEIEERPLLATLGLAVPQNAEAHWVFAAADRCFAAAYFRRLQL